LIQFSDGVSLVIPKPHRIDDPVGLLHGLDCSWPSRVENIVSLIVTGNATNSAAVHCVHLPDDEIGVFEE
jgi:hypothetical protein